MSATEIFTNQPFGTVTSGGTDTTSTTWTVSSNPAAPFPAAATGVSQFHVTDTNTAAASEIILVTNISGTTWTVVRGAEGTTPVVHEANFTITQVLTAGWLSSVNSGVNAVDNGGTGIVTAAAYALLAGGTASTTPFQQVAGLGTSGQVLTSQGAGSLPSWTSQTGLVNPMSALGDMISGGTAGTAVRLAGGTVASKKFLTQTGAGTVSAAPVWGTITAADMAGTVATINGGTGLGSVTAYAVVAGGTSSTTALQTVAGLGSGGQVLTSQGAGTLPTWTTATVFNVKNPPYNATGNGSTIDTLAVQAAITAAQVSGGVVYFPPGTYLINSSLLVGGGSPGAIVIAGAGWDSQIKLANAANTYLFDFGSSGSPQYTPGLTFRDLYLNCNGANQTSAGGGIYARGAVWCLFDHLWIETPWEAGIRFYQDGTGSNGHHNTMRDCLFRDGKNSNGGQGWAIKFQNSDENHCTGCTFQDNGVQLGAGHDAQVYDTTAGLQTFTGCHFVGGGTSVPMMFSDSSPGRCSFTGCQFDSPNGADCMILNGPGHMVTGNMFLGIGVAASGKVGGVHLGGTSGVVVQGNSFYSSSATYAVAVYEDSGAGPNFIGPNTVSGTWGSGPFQTNSGGGSVISPAAAAGGNTVSQGSGAPSKPNGNNPAAGDIWFRTDTPSTSGQQVYICTTGGTAPVWTACSPVSFPVTVPEGGTGGTAVTAYAVVTGGTSSATALQTVSGVGTAGQGLLSNGAGSLPSWQTTVNSVTAADTSIVIAGTGAAPTVSSPRHATQAAKYSGVAGQPPRESIPFWGATTNNSVTAGVMYLMVIPVEPGDVISNVGFVSGSTAAGMGTNPNWWTALYTAASGSTATLVAQSGTQGSAAIGAATAHLLALQSPAPYTVPTLTTYVYGAVMINTGAGGTQPTMRGPAMNVATVDASTSLFTTSAIYSGTNGTSLGGTAPSGTVTLAANLNLLYLGAD